MLFTMNKPNLPPMHRFADRKLRDVIINRATGEEETKSLLLVGTKTRARGAGGGRGGEGRQERKEAGIPRIGVFSIQE